jgi:inosose dehydratase
MGLTTEEWSHFAAGCNAVAEAVLRESGLRTVFHHHCAGYVETPGEIERLLALTDPARVGLVFDTGHYVFGAGEADTMIDFLERNAARIWYMHFKECNAELAGQSRGEEWNYFTSLQHGIFGELGLGAVDFAGVAAWLRCRNYDDVITVEQDVLPGMGAPKASARRNREFLRSIGL